MTTHLLLQIAGATAGAASVLVSMPLECIKTVIDTCGSPAEGLATVLQFWATGRSIVAANGCGALYRGLSPALVRIAWMLSSERVDGLRPCDLSSVAICVQTALAKRPSQLAHLDPLADGDGAVRDGVLAGGGNVPPCPGAIRHRQRRHRHSLSDVRRRTQSLGSCRYALALKSHSLSKHFDKRCQYGTPVMGGDSTLWEFPPPSTHN